MNKEDYDKAMADAEERALKEILMIQKTYAMSNNPYDVGDIIEDHIGYIRIENISPTKIMGSKYPCCIYNGLELTKKLEPRKDGRKRRVYQDNIK